MSTKTDFGATAVSVIAALGGPDNIKTVNHCITRLRFVVADASKVDEAAIETAPGVVTLMKAGGQHQVVIGNEVEQAFAAVVAQPGMAAKNLRAADNQTEAEATGNLMSRFIQMISAIFLPMLWPLAGFSMIKALLAVATTFHWLSTESQTYIILYAIGDAVIYFMPLSLAVTASRKFKVNEFLGLAVVFPLVYPSIVDLNNGEAVHFFGIPVVMMTYTSSVIPAVVAVWLTSLLAHQLEKIMPAMIKQLGVNFLCGLIMVPVVLITVGPATTWVAMALSSAIGWVFHTVPLLGGAIMGAGWQVFVIFGLHWGIAPLFTTELANNGFSLMAAPVFSAVIAQGAAALAVAVRSRNEKMRKMAGPAAFSGIVAGITEPAIYGLNLPLKVPFVAGCIGGAIGGAITAVGGNAMTTFVVPSLLALPGTLGHGGFAFQVIGVAVASVVAFVITFIGLPFVDKKQAAAAAAPAASQQPEVAATVTAAAGASVGVILPVTGAVIPLAEVKDPVFSSGAMGAGFAVEPTSGNIIAPVSGTVIAAPKSAHAYGIKTDSGVEVLVHVGIDTVQMNGAGFTRKVTKGQKVTAGDPLVAVDLEQVAAAGHPATVIVVVTNTKKMQEVRVLDPGANPQPGEAGLLVTV